MTNEMKETLEALKESYKQGYKDAIDKACEWLTEKASVKIVEDFKKAMEEQQ